MPKYILCPRCELNYILEGDGYCDVCKAELKIGPQLMFSVEEENHEQILCPVCKMRYMSENDEMCEQCREDAEYKRSQLVEDVDIEKDEEWRRFLDDDEKDVLSTKGDEEEMVSLSEIEEEEYDDYEDEEDIDPYTNERITHSKRDDDDFDYAPINESDFEDYNEEEEEEDEEEDF